MVAIVAVETLLLLLLLVLVAGLLRSHAEILRRLSAAERGSPGAGEPDGEAVPGTWPADGAAPAPAAAPGERELVPAAVTGVTPDGDAVAIAFEGPGSVPTLLAFLTSGCSSCAAFWDALGERRLPPSVQTVIVTHGADRERPSRLRGLAPEGVPVVMSSAAWTDYRVPGSPYFVLVDTTVRGEGAATSWKALSSLVTDAIEDERDLDRAAGSSGGEARTRDIDATLTAAGIGRGHTSLYPGGRPEGR